MPLPDKLRPGEAAELLNRLSKIQMEARCYLTVGHTPEESAELTALLPGLFREMADAINRPEITGSLLFHAKVGELLLGNVRLVTEAQYPYQETVLEQMLNHLPLQLEIIGAMRQPSPQTAMRMAISFVDTVPLALCSTSELSSAVKMMCSTFSSGAFVHVAEHILEHLLGLREAHIGGTPKGLLAESLSVTDMLLSYQSMLFREERNMNDPFYQFLQRREQDFISLRPLVSPAKMHHDINFIGELYRNDLEALATSLSLDWISNYEGTDLIQMLEDVGFDASQERLQTLWQDLAEADADLNLMMLNLLDFSLARENFDMLLDASHIRPESLTLVAQKLLMNIPEAEAILQRTGSFIDELCASLQNSKAYLSRSLAKSPYWRHSSILSEQQLIGDLGL